MLHLIVAGFVAGAHSRARAHKFAAQSWCKGSIRLDVTPDPMPAAAAAATVAKRDAIFFAEEEGA